MGAEPFFNKRLSTESTGTAQAGDHLVAKLFDLSGFACQLPLQARRIPLAFGLGLDGRLGSTHRFLNTLQSRKEAQGTT